MISMNDTVGNTPSAMPTMNPALNQQMPGSDPKSAMPPGGGAPPAGQNPLDALEQILQQAKAGKGGVSPDAKAAEEKAKLEEQKKQDEILKFQALQEEKKLADAAALQQKLEELKSVEQSPQNQARIEQDQQKQSEQQQYDDAIDGFEIQQIHHTKL